MTLPQSPWQPENEVERLLCSLAGVVSARVVANPLGRLDEIHILASPLLSPKQVVRNVESALAAGLGIVIDRRIISVAQIRRDALEPLVPDGEGSNGLAVVPEPSGDGKERDGVRPEQRIIFVGWDARSQPNVQAECRVTVRRDGRDFTGSGSAGASPQGRALAAARAVFAAVAVARGQQDLFLEDAKIVETHGRTYVLVAARAIIGRQSRPLTGVSLLERSPEEAAILASLQATNRWTGKED
jgi:hypothetical protein